MRNMSMENKTRMPAVAGQFYPSDREELKKLIRQCFVSEFGPGSLPGSSKKKSLPGAIAPHAGYQFSGPCAAWAYKEIGESDPPDTFVILGLSHSGLPSCVSLSDWKTPLGTARNDIDFSKAVEEEGVPADEDAHSQEHSIEVQVPFLQFACPDARICPVIASHDMDYRKIAEAVKNAAKKLKRRITVIASSDFTHYGPAYGYVPFNEDIKKNIYKLDKGAIELIKKLDAIGFLDYAAQKQATICGQMPIAALLETVEAKKAKLLKYYTSGDIVGDYANAVGYASLVLE